MSMMSSQIQGRMQDAILFDTNVDSLKQMNLTEHLSRLDQMSKYLTSAIQNHRQSLIGLQDVVKTQINGLKTSYQIMQTQIKQELDKQKKFFQPSITTERKIISDMKAQVQKITSEQLTTKKNTLNIQAQVSKMQGQIGFLQVKNSRY